MAVKSTARPVAETATPWENPLIPSKKLRQLYTAMVEMRLLEEHLSKQRTKPSERPKVHHGEEGCFVSTVLSLSPNDHTSESSLGIAIDFLRGAKLAGLVSKGLKPASRPLTEIPIIEDSSARLYLAIGAATTLASKKKRSLVVAYVSASDLAISDWKPILRLAAREAAPLIFVVLPAASGVSKTTKPGQLSLISTACGVPGIPIDAADPVALYRVAQESMLRARAGGGPVLMECIPFQLAGKRAEPADPILTMQQFMLPRKVADEAWFEGVAKRFKARLEAAAS